jgi:hypothetical protein
VKWLADECFDNDILRGMLRCLSGIDVIRAQDVVEVAGRDDAKLLAWATEHERVVLTHDLATMIPALLRQRQQASKCTPNRPCARFAGNRDGNRRSPAARPVLGRF